jgi:hypothetical protein
MTRDGELRLIRWIGGIAVPLPLALYGLRCIFARQAMFFSGQRASFQMIELLGGSAVAVGLLYAHLAAFLHALVFWCLEPRYASVGRRLAVASAIGVVASVLLFVWFFIVRG